MAEATEMGGVIIPSANSVVAPNMVGITNLPFQNVLLRHKVKKRLLLHGYQPKALKNIFNCGLKS